MLETLKTIFNELRKIDKLKDDGQKILDEYAEKINKGETKGLFRQMNTYAATVLKTQRQIARIVSVDLNEWLKQHQHREQLNKWSWLNLGWGWHVDDLGEIVSELDKLYEERFKSNRFGYNREEKSSTNLHNLNSADLCQSEGSKISVSKYFVDILKNRCRYQKIEGLQQIKPSASRSLAIN